MRYKQIVCVDFWASRARGSFHTASRWSQRRLRLEFMNGLSYTTIIELVSLSPVGVDQLWIVRPHCPP